MIIGPDFVWLHFPKCAGVAVESALRTLLAGRLDVCFDPIDPKNVIWHHTVARREKYDDSFRLGRRRVICGFRRLPEWVLSRAHYEAARPPHYRTVSREMLVRGAVYEQDGDINQADTYVRRYADPRVDEWVRTENLVEDLSAAFALEPEAVRNAMQRLNVNSIPYVRSLSFWFTENELRELYAANPVWAQLETELYGSLMVSLPAAEPVVPTHSDPAVLARDPADWSVRGR